MKKLFRSIAGMLALAAAVIAAPLSTTAALAADVLVPVGYGPSMFLAGITTASAYTNSTASYTDITGTAVTLPATNDDFAKQYIRVCFSADVTKATATSGNIQVYINGGGIAASRRYSTSAAGQNTVAGCYTAARSAATAQTVKLQAASADTNLFTVSNVTMEVWIIRALA